MKLHIQIPSKHLKLIVNILLIGCGRLSGLGGRSDLGTLLGCLGAIGQAVHLVLAVLLDEGNEVLNGTGSGVLNRGVLGTSGVELDSGEASDGIGHIVGSGINLGHGDLLVQLRDIGVQRSKFLVLGSKSGESGLEMEQMVDELYENLRLAVSAPGSVKFNQDILLVVNDNLLVVAANNNGNRSLLSLGNGLGLEARLNLAVKDVLDELADILGIDLLVLVVRVLGVLGSILDSESRELLGLKVEVTSVSAEELSIKGNNVNSSTVALSDGTEISSELLALLGSLGEDVSQGDTGLTIVES